MIRYALTCDNDHEFESWFRDSAAYDQQAEKGTLECPVCGSRRVHKSLMAPSIAKGDARRSSSPPSRPEDKLAMMMTAVRRHVEENYEHVGDKFAEEARRIHNGEADRRDIYGEATPEEAKDLIDEGVDVAPLPGPPKPRAN